MVFLLAALVGAVFGGADQYLGSLSAIPWLVDSSLLSAPWLLLPFVFGCTQRSSKRAMVIGCVTTAFALIGYFVMTLSPVEGVHLHGSLAPVLGLLRSERTVIVGSVFTAPLYGFLGYEWRAKKAWVSALLVGGAAGNPHHHPGHHGRDQVDRTETARIDLHDPAQPLRPPLF